MARSSWMLYGATGYTGRLIARHAAAAGERPVLGGRDPDALAALGAELDLETRHAALDDPPGFARMLDGQDVLVNAAGPFALTQSVLAEVCLLAGVDYCDLSGDAPLLEGLGPIGARFAEAGLALVPGIGFDVAFSDAVIADAARRVGSVASVRLGLAFHRPAMSRGSWKSALEEPHTALVRRAGRLCERPADRRRETFDFGEGQTSGEIVTWGDLVTAAWTTGASDVTVLVEADWVARLAGVALDFFRSPWGSWLGQRMIPLFPIGPDARQRERNHCRVVAEVTDRDGKSARTTLRGNDPYDMTARAVVEAMRHRARLEPSRGLLSPSQAFGADMFLAIAGCEVISRR